VIPLSPESTDSLVKLGAVILGFLLSELSQFLKGSRAAEKARRSARLLVSLERKHNIELLGAYWNGIARDSANWMNSYGHCDTDLFGKKIASQSFPAFDFMAYRKLWEVALAAFGETELVEIMSENEKLRRLLAIRESFARNVELSKAATTPRVVLQGWIIPENQLIEFIEIIARLLGDDSTDMLPCEWRGTT
jgi:hypothetical protein